MSCSHCCGANQLFDEKIAKKDLRRYLKKGPRKPTKLMVDALKKVNLKGLSLLDIGGGIGPIHLELIPEGISKITDVDSSAGYINVAEGEAEKRGYKEIIKYHFGDFVEDSAQISTHDIVTMDKVICCYPYVDELLKASLSKATKYYAVVYPQTNLFEKVTASLLNLCMKIKKNPFRTFIHPTELIQRTIENAGFKEIYRGKTLLKWQVYVYER